jgi:hypothetical protein
MRSNGITQLAIASLLAIAVTGCFVFDEIDNAGKFEPPPGSKAVAKSAGAAEPGAEKSKAGATPAGAAAKPAAPSGDAWWRTASSVTSEESSDSSITSCALGGRTEFMQREDCLARGGKPE